MSLYQDRQAAIRIYLDSHKTTSDMKELARVPGDGDPSMAWSLQGLDVVDDFDAIAASAFREMLSTLVGAHQSRVRSLHSEITTLREKLRHAENKSTLHAQDGSSTSPVQQSNGTLADTPLVPNNQTLECQPAFQATFAHAVMPALASPEKQVATAHEATLAPQTKPTVPRADSSISDSPDKRKNDDRKETMKRVGAVVAKKQAGRGTHRRQCIPSPPDNRLRRFINGNTFECVTGAIILANTFMMALQAQYAGLDLGHSIRPGTHPRPAKEAWPGADTAFFILDTAFNVLFTIELLLRLYAHTFQSIVSPWMWFDTIIVVLGNVETLTDGGGIGIDPTMMRLVRLVRLVRLLKVFKAMSEFDSLFLLLKSISASIDALIWSLLILFFVQAGSALFLCQMLSADMENNDDDSVRDGLFMYFGTFSRAMMTMFEITLANWVPTCRFLMENIHEAYFLFYLMYRCMFCFAVLKVIAAVFISETNRVLACDVELTLMKAAREKAEFTRKLLAILHDMDDDGNGTVTFSEVEVFLQDPDTPLLLTTVGFDRDDVKKVFMLTQEDGSVNIEKFVANFLELKGQSKTVDLQNMFRVIQEIKDMDTRWTSLLLQIQARLPYVDGATKSIENADPRLQHNDGATKSIENEDHRLPHDDGATESIEDEVRPNIVRI